MAVTRTQAQAIGLVLLDVDGVLTAGGLGYHDPEGETKTFHSRDGHAIRMALARGLAVGVCSGRSGAAVRRRCHELGCEPVLLGVGDKLAAVDAALAERALTWAQLAYLADDLPDLACLRRAGLGVAVRDAGHRLARHADHVTRLPGGAGAVGEFLLEVLALRDALTGDDGGASLHG